MVIASDGNPWGEWLPIVAIYTPVACQIRGAAPAWRKSAGAENGQWSGAQGHYGLRARHLGAVFRPENAPKQGDPDNLPENLCTIRGAVVKDQFAIKVNP
ncbi:MAG TPA: hypothetical protein VLG17_21905 [Pseudomonas sp.]|uniref:hypothetical protein n=1 Tax=Pseudomonas sp. TaxID=306 RepID=UPI002C9AC2E3|nr:hypothetical protein [Pseudomonas sp.]HSX90641.1 hypothetical protein [Pseudomonas sp.]